MNELERSMRGAADRFEPPSDWLERVRTRARARRRNRRVLAGAVGLGLALAVLAPLARQLGVQGGPATVENERPPSVTRHPVWRITGSTRCVAGCEQGESDDTVRALLTLFDNETGTAHIREPGTTTSRESWDIGGWAYAQDGVDQQRFVLFDITVAAAGRSSPSWIPFLDLGVPGAAGRYPMASFLGLDAPAGETFEVAVAAVPGARVVNPAGEASATASNALEANPPGHAIDGDRNTLWNSGDFPPQTIEIDLGAPYPVGEIALLATQLPDGDTVHRIYGRASGEEDYRLLGEFDGPTRDSEVLRLTVPAEVGRLRFIRVETVTSPSWVGWREIAVYPP